MAGVGVACVLMPFNAVWARWGARLHDTFMTLVDQRMRVMNELLHGIRGRRRVTFGCLVAAV